MSREKVNVGFFNTFEHWRTLASVALLTVSLSGCRSGSDLARQTHAIERLLLRAAARDPVLDPMYHSIDRIGKTTGLTRRPWGGVNKRRTGDEVIVYVVDHRTLLDRSNCEREGPQACQSLPAFADDCIAFGPATIVCDARLMAKLQLYAFTRSVKISLLAMAQRFLELKLSALARVDDGTVLEVTESLLSETGGLRTLDGFRFGSASMAARESVELAKCDASYAACMQELDAASAAADIYGQEHRLNDLLLAGTEGYLGFMILHELGHINLGHTERGADEREAAELEQEADEFAVDNLGALKSSFSIYIAPFLFVERSRTFVQQFMQRAGRPMDSMSTWQELDGRTMERLSVEYIQWACVDSHPRMLERFMRFVRHSSYRYPDISAMLEADTTLATACQIGRIDGPMFRRYGAWLLSI